MRFFEAARVARACVLAGLDAAACAFVDRQCTIALTMQPWSRVRGRVDGWILLADPALAAEREREEAQSADGRAAGRERACRGYIREAWASWTAKVEREGEGSGAWRSNREGSVNRACEAIRAKSAITHTRRSTTR